ncbi:MAG: methylmalonyl Co-A mutase-associated GTPase MeaB [Rhizobiales bacterium]|nr:methylmalonyl Co-A mutase-associated GTPase MeaB [Hyphomicrobiales bacterium]
MPDFEALISGRKVEMSRALAAIEARPEDADVQALLAKAWENPRAAVAGLTGPPGVGKSTLTSALVAYWRAKGETVGVVAVDPSSRRTGGALLGDRTRILTDPADQGVFIRSMAARDRLGGLADLTFPALVAMRAVYDRVLVETVGIGQSETDIADMADTVIFCVQPGSGDSLQFMKAGIMEVPDIAVVTKADMGAAASRAVADVKGALGLSMAGDTAWDIRVLSVSSSRGQGIEDLAEAIDVHGEYLRHENRLHTARRRQAVMWLRNVIHDRYGRDGLQRVAAALTISADESPFQKVEILAEKILASRA